MHVIRASEMTYVASSHEDQHNPHVLKKVLLEKADIAPGRLQMLNWAELQPNKSFNAHYHEDMTEVFVIINGSTMMKVDDVSITLEKGDIVVVEPREVHTMTNTTDEPFEYIVFGISQEKGGKTVVVQ